MPAAGICRSKTINSKPEPPNSDPWLGCTVPLAGSCRASIPSLNSKPQTVNWQEIGSLLIENKANLDAPDEDGWTPLHWACSSDALSCLAILVLSGKPYALIPQLCQPNP